MVECCFIPIEISEQDFEIPISVLESETFETVFDGITYPVYPETYHGEYDIVPTTEKQVLDTKFLTMADNVIIEKIPDCYGLISWNGSRLRIS